MRVVSGGAVGAAAQKSVAAEEEACYVIPRCIAASARGHAGGIERSNQQQSHTSQEQATGKVNGSSPNMNTQLASAEMYGVPLFQ